MASVGILQARTRILHIRDSPHKNVVVEPYAMPEYVGASKRIVIDHIREFKDHNQHLRSDSQLENPVDRAEHVWALENYEECDQANGGQGTSRATVRHEVNVAKLRLMAILSNVL